jgi:hypothetical protein
MLQVDDAKAFIRHRVVEKVEAKEIPHQVGILFPLNSL